MRLNNLVDDQEYLEEKKKLLTEKIRLEQGLKNENKEKDVDQETQQALTLASQGMNRFKNGSLEDKKGILQEIGSNFFLKDRKLIIEAEKPFLILEGGLKKINGNIERLEPARIGFTESKIRLSLSQIQSWCAVVEDVRTFSRKENAIDKFKQLYQEEFGEILSDHDAFDKFSRLANFTRVVLAKSQRGSGYYR
jgi:hypothetical protein